MQNSKLLVNGTPPPKLERELSVVGKSINRLDGLEKVTGEARYSGDLKMPGMLYGKILHCPHPRARIVRLNTDKAEALPGVKAIITRKNCEGWRTYWYNVPELAFADVLTHEGQEVAVVAAEDPVTAQKAIELIDVEYEILTPMINAEEVLNSPPPELVGDEEYPNRDIFDRKPFIVKRGDMEKGLAEADAIIENTYTLPPQYHATIQTRACIADWDGQKLTVWDAAQGVWNSKRTFAKSLNLDPDNVRVIVDYLGGGFGSKGWSQRISYYAAKLAMVTQKPVRMERTRPEEFLNHAHRPECKVYFKIGAKKDGTLTAIQESSIANVGNANGKANCYPQHFNWHTSNLYKCANVNLEQFTVLTNYQTTGPMRAPLNMPAIFCLETHIDMLADAINMDPLEFRMKNYTNFAYTHTEARLMDKEMQIPWSSKQLDKCMFKVTETIGWKNREKIRKASVGPKKRGIGMAAFIAQQSAGKLPNEAYADVEIFSDGTINLRIGIVDIGGGQRTIFAMFAAEELGVKTEDINVIYGDTEGTRYGPSCHVSRATAEMGAPIIQAAADARQQLFKLAAPDFAVKETELESRDGMIYIKSDHKRTIAFTSACKNIDPGKPLHGKGSRKTNPDNPLFSSFGAQAAEVEVDIETGEVNIIRMTAAHDFGKAINPKLCISQIVGGIEIGIGYALSEEGIYDKKTGRMLNHNFHQYRQPTSLDMPPIEAFLIDGEIPDPYFAYGARGGAEVTNTPTPAAIGNAIHHAIGIWITDLPITPDKILNAIQAKKKER